MKGKIIELEVICTKFIQDNTIIGEVVHHGRIVRTTYQLGEGGTSNHIREYKSEQRAAEVYEEEVNELRKLYGMDTDNIFH